KKCLFDTFKEANTYGEAIAEGRQVPPANFHEDAKNGKEEESNNSKDPILDTIFDNFEKLIHSVTEEYMIALQYLAQDKLKTVLALDPDKDEILQEVQTIFKKAINEQKTIRQAIGDPNGELDSYVATTRSLMHLEITPKVF